MVRGGLGCFNGLSYPTLPCPAGEGVSIFNNLGKETDFINVRTSIACLKCQRVRISTAPSFGNEVVFRYAAWLYLLGI